MNTKTLRFNSKYLCPNTEAVDAFTQNWESENNLLVPPVGDICRVIKYFENKHVSGTLLVPYWKSAPFWALLCDRNGFKNFIKEYLVINRGGKLLNKKSILTILVRFRKILR